MTNVQITIWFRRETCLHPALILMATDILQNYLLYKIMYLFIFRVFTIHGAQNQGAILVKLSIKYVARIGLRYYLRLFLAEIYINFIPSSVKWGSMVSNK